MKPKTGFILTPPTLINENVNPLYIDKLIKLWNPKIQTNTPPSISHRSPLQSITPLLIAYK